MQQCKAQYTRATKLNSSRLLLKLATTWIRQFVAVDFVADTFNFVADTVDFVVNTVNFVTHTVDSVASVYGAKAAKSTVLNSTLSAVCTGL